MSDAKKEPIYPCAFIPDGYTRTVSIDGVPGEYPPCTFTYRPFRGIERSLWFSRVYAPELGGEGAVDKMLAERISAWDLRDAQGHPAAIHANTMAKLGGAIYGRILDVLMGKQPDGAPSDAELEEEDGPN